jgi:hypothetical protein
MLFLLIGVSDQSREQVDLADVLELVVDGFNRRSFAQQQFIA